MDSAKAVLVIVFSSSLLEIPLFRFCQDYCSSVIGRWEEWPGLPAVQLNTNCKRMKSKQTVAFRVLLLALSQRCPEEPIPTTVLISKMGKFL